ncbi:MAG: hypothetical protein ACKOB7_04905 [Methylocystis sp.]
MKEDDPKMIMLRKQFADVLNPVDVENSLKEIYPDHLYTPTADSNDFAHPFRFYFAHHSKMMSPG